MPPPPPGLRGRTAVDLDRGAICGHVDMLVLDDDALLAARPVAFQRFELGRIGVLGSNPRNFQSLIKSMT
jgi:hypothetical protein